MPAKLDRPATKIDIRLYDDDIAFLRRYLEEHNSNLNVWTRDLIHRAANELRQRVGLPPT